MRIRYRYQSFEIGDQLVRLRIPINLDDLFERGEGAGFSRDAFPLFGIVWASGELLAHLVLDEDMASKRVLEVGCGLALSSLLLRRRGVDVTAMDIHPLAAELLAGNASINACGEIPFVCTSWSNENPALGRFDLIIGSDILYEPRHAEHLPAFMNRHVSANGQVLIVDPERGQTDSFVEQMQQSGFESECWQPDFVDHLNIPYRGTVYRFRR